MNKQSLICLCMCLSILAMLVASLAIPLNTARSQTTEPETHRVYIPLVPVAPERLEQQWLGSLGGTTGWFYISGNLAFMVVPGRLQLVDVSNPRLPMQLSELALPGNPIQITVRDGYAYLAMGYLGMAILDIRALETPVIAAILPLVGNTTHLLLSGNLAYLSNSLGLFSVDISQPRSPLVLSRVDISANQSMFLHDKLLVVGSALNIFDLSTPTHPTQISQLNPGEWTSGGWAWLNVYNDRAYIATYGCGMHGCAYGIDVFDLSDPYHPGGIGYIDTVDYLPNLQFNNDLVYMADGWELKTFQILSDGSYTLLSTLDVPDGVGWMYYENNRLYITTSGSIQVIDVSDPGDPDSIGSFTPEIPCGLIQPVLPLIYCGFYIQTVDNKSSGIEVFDMSDPDEAEWIGAYETNLISFSADHVYLDGDQLYISSNTGAYSYYGSIHEVRIYDLSDPAAPQIAKQYVPSRGYGLWNAGLYESVQISNQIGYIITMFNDLEITDLSDPSNPQVLSTYESNSEVVRVEEPYVYLVSKSETYDPTKYMLLTLDASNLLTPTIQSSYVITETYSWYWDTPVFRSIDVSGGIAYLGLRGQMQLVDVRDARHPALLSTLPLDTWQSPTTIQVEGNLALVGHDGILEVVDVTDPSAPAIVGSLYTGGTISAVQIIDRLAYVACRETGAQVIDLADPANPRLVKQYYGNTASIQTSPGYPVYLANQWDGLQIYKPYPLNTRR